ncbi:MAG: tRNA (adenosine(37)-N6)-dimethylallyltransferase MiaA [Bacteroidaceae bacterium]|nr:tRNA (adenosine(37)-N6)-dimethylallyltransferase MiaA [Bacteroidaceae bacterium]
MTLFVLLGPTAVGKTELALKIADHIGSPILNCDSRQLFRGMRIGTAAPTPQQLERTTHYFVGTLDLSDYYSAARYEADALDLIQQLSATHSALLLSGGSMLYIDAVCKGIDDIPTIDNETRSFLRSRYSTEGLAPLLEELRLMDPEYYQIVDQRNTQRVIHALEICYATGRTYTSFRTQKHKPRPFHIVKIGLQRPREELFSRINCRVEQMMDEGFLEEARALLPYRHENALNTVGYKEIFAYFDGKMSYIDAVERIKKNTRVYAKKQMTWFQRDKEINWFHPNQEAEILTFVGNTLHGRDMKQSL